MKKPLPYSALTRACLFGLLVVLAIPTTSSAAARSGLPPSFGKLCGHVTGAPWQFQGRRGTQYNVTGIAAACTTALKSVGGLTKQKPHSGALGTNTLVGPGGFQCAGSGIPLAHAGFCGSGGKHFVWAPLIP